MGNTHSPQENSDTETSPSTSKSNSPDRSLFAIFQSRRDDTLDSTDSEITMEDPHCFDCCPDNQKIPCVLSHDNDSRSALNATGSNYRKYSGSRGRMSNDPVAGFAANSKRNSYLSKSYSREDGQQGQGFNNFQSNQNISSKCRINNCPFASEVMHDYQRYSREPPEKDQNYSNCPVRHNMNSCCRSCCVALQSKIEPPARLNKSNSNRRPHRSQLENYCNPRRVSDPYVACRNNTEKNNPSLSKSAPSNTAPRGKSYQSRSRIESNKKPPAIPQPPPPPIKSREASALLKKQRSSPKQYLKPNSSAHKKTIPEQSSEITGPMYNPRNYTNYNSNANNKNPYKYPYEEPTDSTTYSHDTNCSNNCTGYDRCPQHRSCKCHCMCDSSVNYYHHHCSDDQMSCCSDSSKSDFMNLAYQRTGDYPELVDELENTLSQRNRMRVQKTMQQFEMLSRQNKNLEKPIFDDDESTQNNRNRNHRARRNNEECKCGCCKARPSETRRQMTHKPNDSYKNRSESLPKRPSFQAQPRNSGYVEKVARYMDPNFNNENDKKRYQKAQGNDSNVAGHGSWQMDARKGEWVKVGQKQYDFENHYPPLPPRPRSGHMTYDNRHDYSERNSSPMEQHSCSCSKCSRHNR